MEIVSKRSKAAEYLLVILGVFLMAVGVNVVYEPVGLVTGGISGLAIIIKEFSRGFMEGGIPVWLTNVVVNIPLFVIAAMVLGKKYVGKTLFATVWFSVALYIVPSFNIQYQDLLLASVFGGVIGGIGIGLVFATSSSTGGTDLIGAIVHHYVKHYSVAKLLMVIDGVIVFVGAAVFGLNKALYAVIAVFITSKVMDAILEGLKFAKLAYIISEQYEEIADEILNEIGRGVTGLSATGMYMQQERKMLFCVVSQKEIIQLIDIVAKKDPKAFVIVSDVREVMGEGFIEYRQ